MEELERTNGTKPPSGIIFKDECGSFTEVTLQMWKDAKLQFGNVTIFTIDKDVDLSRYIIGIDPIE